MNVSGKALDMAREEVPEKKNVKLKAQDIKLPDDLPGFKFQEFSRLPKHVQLLLARQTEQLVEKFSGDATDRVAFQFQSSESSSLDPRVLEDDMRKAADQFINGEISLEPLRILRPRWSTMLETLSFLTMK